MRPSKQNHRGWQLRHACLHPIHMARSRWKVDDFPSLRLSDPAGGAGAVAASLLLLGFCAWGRPSRRADPAEARRRKPEARLTLRQTGSIWQCSRIPIGRDISLPGRPTSSSRRMGRSTRRTRGRTACWGAGSTRPRWWARCFWAANGADPSRHLEAIYDEESAGGRGISEALGLAGFTNLDVVRNPNLGPVPYLARVELHQTIGLTQQDGGGRRGTVFAGDRGAGAAAGAARGQAGDAGLLRPEQRGHRQPPAVPELDDRTTTARTTTRPTPAAIPRVRSPSTTIRTGRRVTAWR